MRRWLGALALSSLALLGACDFYFGGDDDCSGGLAEPAPVPETRDPYSGQCVTRPGGGGGGCGDVVPVTTGSAGAPAEDIAYYPGADWALCYSYCESLSETDCLAADACRAIYTDGGAFAACWATAPSGPIRGGDCSAITDAQVCSQHDDCVAVHTINADGSLGSFASCGPEPTCIGGGVPIVPAALLRNPDNGQCIPSSGGGGGGCMDPLPPPPPPYDWAVCSGYCEALDESSCAQADGCRAAYVDACPVCDALVLRFAGCWGTAPSGPVRGTPCSGLNAQECSRHDDCSPVHQNVCPDGSVLCDGVYVGPFAWCQDERAPAKGCYGDGDCDSTQHCNASEVCLPPPGCDPTTGGCPTVCYGYCVDGPPPPVCADITDERTCIGALGCEPIYRGSGCGCDATGVCGCTDWTFLSCTDGSP